MSYIHIAYILLTIIILGIMLSGREIVVPCIFAIFTMAFLVNFSVIDGMSGLYNSIVYSGQKFMDIIITISVVSALSKLLSDLNSDYLIMKPTEKLMKNQYITFYILIGIMYGFSLFLWPSPSVALMGAVMLPIVYKKGMKPIVAAVAINIAGHGMALSHDFIIKGAPTVTASTANISAEQILSDGKILFIVMNLTVLIAATYMLRKELSSKNSSEVESKEEKVEFYKGSKIVAILTPVTFIADLIAIRILDLRGGDATALIVSCSLFLLVFGTFVSNGKDAFDKVAEYLREGFKFGIKIFAPVIIIGAFFFMGSDEIGKMIGEVSFTTEGILSDIVTATSTILPMNKFFAVITMFIMGAISGLDGSGFSGLPILGSLSFTLGNSLGLNVAVLATIGQIATIWVGGGVLVPWAVVTVSGICDISPMELCKKNAIPVCIGFLAMLITAIFIL